MTETGIIKAINGRRVTVGCGDVQGCGNCAGKAFCTVKERNFEAENDQDLSLQVGDQVRVYLPPGRTVFSAFLVMILPLILFVVFFLAARRFLGVETEIVQVLWGLLGLAAGFGVSFLYSRSRNQNRPPRVIQKID